jgi:hypothetical protein
MWPDVLWVAIESLGTPHFSGVRLIKDVESADFPLGDIDPGSI